MPAIVATQSSHFEDVAARSKRALEVANVREGPGRVNGGMGNQDFQFLRGPHLAPFEAAIFVPRGGLGAGGNCLSPALPPLKSQQATLLFDHLGADAELPS